MVLELVGVEQEPDKQLYLLLLGLEALL